MAAGFCLTRAREKAQTARPMNCIPASVVAHTDRTGGYRLLVFRAPGIAAAVQPGQFVHVRIPRMEQAVLRRPFSIYRADAECLSVLYKVIGEGTRVMSMIAPGESVNLIGPLGNGFPLDMSPGTPVALVAGGYGVAPLSLLASRLPLTGSVFVGARTAADILCIEDFEALGWAVQVTTEDGSAGERGLVTAPLERWLAGHPDGVLYACGPEGLMRAVGERAIAGGQQAWLSLDKNMGCGVGACLACVQRIRTETGEIVWKRVCKDGPVFEARQVVWEDV